MKSAILFSGGKDSVYTTFLAKKAGHEICCLITIKSENPDSYMFHTPSVTKVKAQAEAMGIPLLIQDTKGEKEKELHDLEKAIRKTIEKYGIKAIFTGAVASVYQTSRVKKICDRFGLKCINPLWQKDPEEYWEELFDNNFEIIIVSVSAEGMGREWLGKIIDRKLLQELKEIEKKYRIHLSFEGGEAETFVINCPIFKKALTVVDKKIQGNKNSWRMEIEVE